MYEPTSICRVAKGVRGIAQLMQQLKAALLCCWTKLGWTSIAGWSQHTGGDPMALQYTIRGVY